jgi:hypothetical protein
MASVDITHEPRDPGSAAAEEPAAVAGPATVEGPAARFGRSLAVVIGIDAYALRSSSAAPTSSSMACSRRAVPRCSGSDRTSRTRSPGAVGRRQQRAPR